MTQVVFAGSAGTIPNLNQNFTQLYDLRELISSPGYAAALPRLTITSGGSLQLASDQQLQWGGGVDSIIGNNALHLVDIYTNNVRALRVDSSQNVLAVAGGGLGYGTGSGGSVTQLTSKTTGVTLNKPTGRIVTHNASLAAGATATFVLNNSVLAATDFLGVNLANVGGIVAANYSVRTMSDAGAAFVVLKNESAGALAEAVTLNFVIIRGVTA